MAPKKEIMEGRQQAVVRSLLSLKLDGAIVLSRIVAHLTIQQSL